METSILLTNKVESPKFCGSIGNILLKYGGFDPLPVQYFGYPSAEKDWSLNKSVIIAHCLKSVFSVSVKAFFGTGLPCAAIRASAAAFLPSLLCSSNSEIVSGSLVQNFLLSEVLRNAS